MWQAFKLTFGSVWSWLGIIVGAISFINLGVMYFEDFEIGPVVERVVETYKAIVHQGFDYLFFWIDWKMPPWLKDTVALYLVFGAASGRAQKRDYDRIWRAARKRKLPLRRGIQRFLLGLILWPKSLYQVLEHLARRERNRAALLEMAQKEKSETGKIDMALAAANIVGGVTANSRAFLLDIVFSPVFAFLFIVVEAFVIKGSI